MLAVGLAVGAKTAAVSSPKPAPNATAAMPAQPAARRPRVRSLCVMVRAYARISAIGLVYAVRLI